MAGSQQHGFTAVAASKPDPAMTDAGRPRTQHVAWPSSATAEIAVPQPGDGTKLSRWNAVLSGYPVEVKQRAPAN
ncbi:hypothetical protein GCM10009789_76600 [Kribbella sancticallisti]|uniref:Uncharacterized protein n=1 Tax=Kribbella sancticallisti TaxID=460087 RepID=A0ABN2ELG0_9ACTN